MPDSRIPATRIRVVTDVPERPDGAYVLYWMTAHRRTRYSFALDRAVEWANRLGRPLLVFEPLRCDYEWASDRFHRFVMEGMADQAARIARSRATYLPYVERRPGQGSGLLGALSEEACVVVADDAPIAFLPRMLRAAAARSRVRMEAIDSNGLFPVHSSEKTFLRAVDFRRHLQRCLPDHLQTLPSQDPLAELERDGAEVPESVRSRWPALPMDEEAWLTLLPTLPIDHSVQPVPYRGGSSAGGAALDAFLDRHLDRYDEGRRDLDEPATSGLSPYLHFGHIGAYEVAQRVWRSEGWSTDRLSAKATGSRTGWWGLSEPGEAFLDQLVTWRELGFNMAAHEPDYRSYESLPAWAKETLDVHRNDPREPRYSLDELEEARTYDEIWNAAQRELRTEGRIHNYLRMLWGKKILEWTGSPEEAADVMIHLNDRWCVDGRDPNSYSGIFWCLGRYDRAWGPERPIFGKIRYMSSESTRRKLKLTGYLERFGEQAGLGL